jgi:hypothetical protein
MKKNPVEYYYMPDGTMCKDIKKYVKAWDDLINPLCKATGAEPYGFDPTIQILYDKQVITLPVSFAIKLNECLCKKEKVNEILENLG